jgi:exosortase
LSDALIVEKAGIVRLLRTPLNWAILVAVALAGVLYAPVFFPDSAHDILDQGEQFFFEANEAAGAPVLALSLWLFYRRSHYRDLLKRRGAPRAAGLVFAITIALFGWGVYAQAPDLQLASSIWLLAGVALLLGGKLGIRAFWVPILFMAFALPISPVLLSAALYPVQLATAQYAGVILNAIGVASFVQGDQILRPENTFIVIETCSGVRTVVTLTMLTVLLIDLFERRGWHAAALIVMAPIVAFLTNGLRVVTLVLNPYSDVASIHNLQGIVMLLVGLTGIYLIDSGIERFVPQQPDQRQDDELATLSGDEISSRASTIRMGVVCGVLLVMVASTHLVTPWSFTRYVEEPASSVLDRAFGEWPSKDIEPDYNFLGSVRYLTWNQRKVSVSGGSVDVFLAAAEEQRREQTILTPRLAWPESGYAVTEDAMRPIASLVAREAIEGEGDGSEAGEDEVRRLILRRGARSVLSYSWYERAESLPVEWFRQAAAIDRSPLARPRHILAVRLSTNVANGSDGLASAEARIRRAYERLAPELRDFAPTYPMESAQSAE